MRHAERAMQSSLEAANNHATSLQHRLAQVIAESSRLHQMLFDTQQCLEGIKVEKVALTTKLNESEDQMKKILSVKAQEINGLRKIVTEKSANIDLLNKTLVERVKEVETCMNKIDTLNKKVIELETEYSAAVANSTEMTNKNHELGKLLYKMQDSINKKEQIIELKNNEIEANQKDISALKLEIQQLTKLTHSYEQTLAEKDQNIQRMTSELTDLSRMRDMIFELTAKKKDDLNTT